MGTTYDSTTYTCRLNCGANSYQSGTSCVCSPGFNKISGICSTCPAGTSYSSSTQNCVNICTGQFQIWSGNQCGCISGYSMLGGKCQLTTAQCGTNKVMTNGICKCLSHLLAYQGGCYACPANSAVTADQSGCMCHAGHTLTSSYTC